LVRALILAFPERAGKDEKLAHRIENTFTDCARFYRFTAPAYTAVKATASQPSLNMNNIFYVYPPKLPDDIDFLNLKKLPWYCPAGDKVEDLRSFPELYSDAVNKAAGTIAAVISAYLEEGVFPIREAAQSIGNGGLSIVDEAGLPCAPVRSDPLPLAEVLEVQLRLIQN